MRERGREAVREGGREGGRGEGHRGGPVQERGVFYSKTQSFVGGWIGLEGVDVWVGRGMGTDCRTPCLGSSQNHRKPVSPNTPGHKDPDFCFFSSSHEAEVEQSRQSTWYQLESCSHQQAKRVIWTPVIVFVPQRHRCLLNKTTCWFQGRVAYWL